MAGKPRSAAQQAALKKAQEASARKRRGTGKSKPLSKAGQSRKAVRDKRAAEDKREKRSYGATGKTMRREMHRTGDSDMAVVNPMTYGNRAQRAAAFREHIRNVDPARGKAIDAKNAKNRARVNKARKAAGAPAKATTGVKMPTWSDKMAKMRQKTYKMSAAEAKGGKTIPHRSATGRKLPTTRRKRK